MPGLTVGEIAEICGGPYRGDGAKWITSGNTLEHASAHEVAFVADQRNEKDAESSQAGCLISFVGFERQGNWAVVWVSNPRKAFAQILQRLYPAGAPTAFRHPTAAVSPSALIGERVHLGAFVWVDDGAVIDADCHLADHVSVGAGCQIGVATALHPHVVIYPETRIGARCILHSGCVIGADGFGFALAEDHYEKFPQIGTVEIGDDVEIGANTCIDRASMGVTRVGTGTKLDNLIHIAHNCQVGRHVVIAAQTGFSGGVTVGDYAVIGGQVGVGERARIEAGAIVGSQGGILPKRRVAAGEPVWGTPARPLRQHLKGLANINRLPQLDRDVELLGRRLTLVEEELGTFQKNERPVID